MATPVPPRPTARTAPLVVALFNLSDEERAAVGVALSGEREIDVRRPRTLDELRDLSTHPHIDLAVCAHRLPASDGLQALRAVRHVTAAVPVVVVAHGGDEATVIAAIRAGAAGYVPAPASVDDLRRALTQALEEPLAFAHVRPGARFEQMLDQLDIGAYRSLPDGSFIEANDATRRLFRLPSLTALMRVNERREIMDERRRQQWSRIIDAEGVVTRAIEWVDRHDGTLAAIEGAARAVRDEQNRYVGFAGYLRDVTEREEATVRARFQAMLLDQVRHPVIGADLDFRVNYWNRHGERLLQRTAAEVTGGDVARALGLDNPDEIRRMVDQALVGEGRWEGVLTAHKKDGTPVVLLVTSRRLENEGRHVGYLGTMIDITEHRRLERELEAALAVRDRLLHDVHHRVHRNLEMVSRLLRLQQARAAHPAVRDLFARTEQRLRAIALIHGWLSPAVDEDRVEIHDYLAQLVESFRATADSGGPSLEITRADRASINPDVAVRLGLITNELLTNALKHAFVDGRVGHVGVQLERTAPDRLMLMVEDDGVGIAPDIDCATTPTLGLPLVRNLAEGLGATLDVRRASGTCVRVTCPVDADA